MLKTKGVFYIYQPFGGLLTFRFITDLSCFILEHTLNNSNPVFHFALPINAILTFRVLNYDFNFKNLSLPYYFLVAILFLNDVYNNSFIESSSTINIGTYFLISFLGFYGTLLNGLTKNAKTIIFPILGYYTILFFYAIFEPYVDKSIFIYDSIFYVFAFTTLSLNLIFSRAIWLKKVI